MDTEQVNHSEHHAPGNAFAFLMTGVSTDYTEIMVVKNRQKAGK